MQDIAKPLSEAKKREVGGASESYREQLRGSREALQYLYDRGFTDELIEGAQLGYVDRPRQGHERARGRISIPYRATTGVVQLRFRAVGDGEPKYYGLPGEPTRLFNAQCIAEARNADTVVICEGEFDTLVGYHLLGLKPAVGVAGVQAWKPHYTLMIEGFENVVLLADHDEAGEKFADDMAQLLAGHNVKKVLMPQGLDLNETFLEGGKEHTLAWIEGRFE